MNDYNCLGWQLNTRIERFDRRIVPGLNIAEEDLCNRWPIKGEFVRLYTIEVHNRDDPAHDHGPLYQIAAGGKFFSRQRLIGSSEGNGSRGDLLDAAAGADRLIVEAVTRFLLIGIGPFCINWIRKSGARARNIGCDRRSRCNSNGYCGARDERLYR